jgi:FKBP-type peptidyl-prolyl cis-trans isomerase SlyD
MAPRVISFHYTMTASSGEEIYSSKDHPPMAYIEGAGQILPGLESELAGMAEGESKRVEVPADKAFGAYDENQVIRVPKNQLPVESVEVGDQFQADQDGPPLTVVEVGSDYVTMDANHPLAGVDLIFDLEVIEVRDATSEELAHGHVHGPGGHHH